jgi:hypothetical protein
LTAKNLERPYHLVETFTLVKEYILVFAMILAVGFYAGHYILEIKNVFWQWVCFSILGLIGLAVVFFNIFPVYLVNKEIRYRPTGDPDKSYFTTTPRVEDNYNLFTSGYEQYLKWLRNPRSPILYLTGSSGTGKSSLINAYLTPGLEKESSPKTNVYVLRSYRDPLKILYQALKGGNGSEENITEEIVHLELTKISNSLSPGERVLIILDQFEEFFLLRNSTQTSPEADEDEIRNIEELKRFFKRFTNDRPRDVTILLSYRDDFQQLIDQLELPARSEHINFEQVNPLNFDQATKFLKSCPGLRIPEDQLDRTLKEAASLDSPVTMRPIVLNLLGIVLQQMVGPRSAPQRGKNMIRGYIIDSLGKELKYERATVLKAMLTDFNTARPRTLEEMSKISRLSLSQLDRQMIAMQHHGLVRCLDPTEPSQGKRKWQIAHDFIALQLEKVVYSVNKTLWQKTRIWIAPALLAVLVILTSSYFGSISDLKRKNAITTIEKAQFSWIQNSRTVRTSFYINITDSQFRSLLPALMVIQPDSLEIQVSVPSYGIPIFDSYSFTTVNGLEKVKSLKKISITNGTGIENLDGLRGLENLTSLELTGCGSLTNLDGIKDLTSLSRLRLSDAYALSNVDALAKLVNLKMLNLNNDSSLQNIDALRGLKNLAQLDLGGCSNLKNVDALKELKSLRELGIFGCSKISESQIEELKKVLKNTQFWTWW